MILSIFRKKREFIKKYHIFKIFKFFYETKISSKIKNLISNQKVESIRLKYKRHKIVKILNGLSSYIKNKKIKIKFFRILSLKVKIFKFLKFFKNKSIMSNNDMVLKFKIFYLKRKFFTLLHKYIYRIHREQKIISRLKKLKKIKKKRLLQSYINSWKKYYICEKYRKIKYLRLITKIFYAMKFY
jgi:hypothetical protein